MVNMLTGVIRNWLSFMKFHRPFRNLFYMRCSKIPNIVKRLLAPEDATFYIASAIKGAFNDVDGGGIYVIHGFGTRIRAKWIGVGCRFRQLTTIGTKSVARPLEAPIIGRNVDFGALVCCFDSITIGDNAVVGAGAVVVKDVPENAIVAGNPAKIIGYRK